MSSAFRCIGALWDAPARVLGPIRSPPTSATPMPKRLSSRRSWSTSSPSRPGRWRREEAMALFEFELPNPNTVNPTTNLGEADLVRRSASSVPAPARQLTPVAKLIDVSKCIGCKACQAACLEWNDKRADIGVNVGVYDNPPDLTPNMFTVMRFTEWVNPQTNNLEWLI